MNEIEKRFELARKELLDLSLKNPLLNYKLRVSTGFEFVKLDAKEVFEQIVDFSKNIFFTLDERYASSRLFVNCEEKEFRRRIVKTYRQSKLYVEEKGANVLYLALGFLSWNEGDSENLYRAPLILVPVEIGKYDNEERYYIYYSGDDIHANISLITKLKDEFNIDISCDEETELNGVETYFDKVEEAVRSKPNWKVQKDQGAFDFFSYAKYLMYRDLDLSVWLNDKQELDNDVLKKLFITNFDDKLSEDIDEEKDFDPKSIHNVVDADSSQSRVIHEINQGHNLVIQGPPGTGKSQTITNIVASSVYLGKSVLFVSEKKAALDVVKRRLENVGLGDLVLELHSEKTSKKDVLTSLERTLSLGEIKEVNTSDTYNSYEEDKKTLDDYKDLINSDIRNSNIPLIDIFGQALLIKERLDKSLTRIPNIDIPDLDKWNYQDYLERSEVIKEFSLLVKEIGKVEKHPLYGVSLTECLPFEQVNIKQKLLEVEEALNDLIDVIYHIGSIFSNHSCNSIFEVGRLINSIDAVVSYKDVSFINVLDPYIYSNRDEMDIAIEKAQKFQQDFKDHSYFDVEKAFKNAERFVSSYSAYSSLSFFAKKKAKAEKEELASYLTSGKYSKSQLEKLNSLLLNFLSLIPLEKQFKYLFKDLYKGLFGTDWNLVVSYVEKGREFLNLVFSYSLLSQTRAVIYDDSKIDELAELKEDYLAKKNDFETKLAEFFNLTQFDTVKRFNYNYWYFDLSFSDLKKVVNEWKSGIESTVEIVRYNVCLDKLNKLGLRGIFEYYQSSNKYSVLNDLFSYYYFDSLINTAYNVYPVLADFREYKLEDTIKAFKELDRKMLQFNIREILIEHYKRMPKINDDTLSMSILRREFQKKRNQMPIRKLFSKTKDIVSKIKPIFMMSPISVASFLPPKDIVFDLVVFDEASQVRPVEAFGALLRAKQIVVVGDSKQLPPTTFFDTMTYKYDEMNDEDYDIANMESILSLLLARNIPQRTLMWHYRSRNRSLITVSNAEFYHNSLKIFPSVDDKDKSNGLVYHYLPNTVYDRGGSRTNKLEAEAVIKEAFRLAKEHPEYSLGVASFSLAQQEQLYQAYDRAYKANDDPDIKNYFASHKDEPFFIKNLESVQGDERDIILISIGYGFDANMNLTMDFGPLNKDGGERRLNVLITRAKVRCEVFTNLLYTDINLSKSSAKGVIALRKFLEYAENRTLKDSRAPSLKHDDFVSYLNERLKEYGYRTDLVTGKEVGIDIAIYDDTKKRFIAGLECDGGAYKDLSSATDRERIRRDVLRNLGWRLYHVYSPEYYRNPKREFNKILDFISQSDQEEAVKESKPFEIERKSSVFELSSLNSVLYKVYSGPKRRVLVYQDSLSLQTLLMKILKVEAPININLLKKRLAEITNIKSLSEEQYDAVYKALEEIDDVSIRDGFIYLNSQVEFPIRNRSELDKASKKIEFIPKEEIENCVYSLIANGQADSQDEIVKLANSLFGFKTSSKLQEEVINCLSALLNANKIALEDGSYYLSNKDEVKEENEKEPE